MTELETLINDLNTLITLKEDALVADQGFIDGLKESLRLAEIRLP